MLIMNIDDKLNFNYHASQICKKGEQEAACFIWIFLNRNHSLIINAAFLQDIFQFT